MRRSRPPDDGVGDFPSGSGAGKRDAMAAILARFTPRALHAKLPVVAQFLRFGTVGVAGFVVDTATVYATMGTLGLYGAGAVAYLTAASANWLFNRLWTFRGSGSGPAHRQWLAFLATNLLGFTLNRGTYFVLDTSSVTCAAQPVWAVAAGAIAGMFVNFHLSRSVVFR
jgi:putative flippase GtrA